MNPLNKNLKSNFYMFPFVVAADITLNINLHIFCCCTIPRRTRRYNVRLDLPLRTFAFIYNILIMDSIYEFLFSCPTSSTQYHRSQTNHWTKVNYEFPVWFFMFFKSFCDSIQSDAVSIVLTKCVYRCRRCCF